MFEELRVWLDDVRPIEWPYNVHVKTTKEAIELLKTGNVVAISLDADLGTGIESGYKVAEFIERGAIEGTLAPLECHVHSMNPVEKQKMKIALYNAYKAWGKL